MSYLPLSHVFERLIQTGIMHIGSAVYFSEAKPEVIKKDLGIIKPSYFPSVPRIYNKFYDKIQSTFALAEGCKKLLLETAVETKLSNLENSCEYNHAVYDKIIFSKIRKDIFGGSVRFLITGSAPLGPDV